MTSSRRVPRQLPVGSKYVLESDGQLVRRFIEFPSGRKIQLADRKALTLTSLASSPDEHFTASNQSRRRSSEGSHA